MTSSVSRTDEELMTLFVESTGRHFLDSGDAYGRHWQRNRERDLLGESPATVSFKNGAISFEHRTLHWLRARVEFDGDANEAFEGTFREMADQNDLSWYEQREAFPEWFGRWRSKRDGEAPCECGGELPLCELCGGCGVLEGSDEYYVVSGLYGDGEQITINTYNEPNLLDQVLLFTFFELRTGSGRGGLEGAYIVLQAHGGCDVRGGYAKPRVFRIAADEPVDILDYGRGTISCDREGDRHWWTTDDGGSHWYFEGSCGRGAGTQLDAYERVDIADAEEWRAGVLATTASGEGRCPLCGGRLVACP